MTVFEDEVFGRWWVHEWGALMNEIIALKEDTPETFSPILPCEDTAKKKKKKAHHWIRKQVLSRHQIYWHLDPGLLSLQNC